METRLCNISKTANAKKLVKAILESPFAYSKSAIETLEQGVKYVLNIFHSLF